MCRRFRFDKICAVITGTEAADTACKIARRWGIKVKGIPATQCTVLGVGGSYHGLAASVWPLMDPSPSRADYGIMSKVLTNVNPTTGERLTYLNLDAMRTCFEDHHERIAAVIMEPLHGCSRSSQDEIVYARGVYDLCRQYNVLFIADEVRQGTAKTGTFFSYQHLGEDCQPDMVTLGKSITAGIYPHAFILGTNAVMSLVGQEHVASTYAMTPVAIVAAQATLEAIDHDNLMERAVTLGKKWRGIIEGWGKHHNIDYVASIGADSNLVMKTGSGYRLAALCMHKGLITYPRPNGLRLSFALTMKDEDLEQGADIIKEALDQLDEYTDVPGENFPC